MQSFWRRYAGDHDLHATWLRHMVDRESRRITKQRIIKSQDVLQGHIPLSAVTGRLTYLVLICLYACSSISCVFPANVYNDLRSARRIDLHLLADIKRKICKKMK